MDKLDLRLFPLAVAALSGAALAIAYASQHWGGLAPCEMCHWQRPPHFVAMTAALAAITALSLARPKIGTALTALAGLALLVGAGIAFYHAGVEYEWWAGPSACGGVQAPAGSLEALRAQVMGAAVIRCDEPAWSIAGVSMAGLNFLLSLGLAGLAFLGASRSWRSA